MTSYQFILIQKGSEYIGNTHNIRVNVPDNKCQQCVIINVEGDPVTTIFSELLDCIRRQRNGEKLISLDEIRQLFDIELISTDDLKCFGCLNNCSGQDEHMECNTGCLHNSTFCDICSL